VLIRLNNRPAGISCMPLAAEAQLGQETEKDGSNVTSSRKGHRRGTELAGKGGGIFGKKGNSLTLIGVRKETLA